MSRQWLLVGVIVGLVVVLIGVGRIAGIAPVVVGSAAPNVVATDFHGNPVQLDDLRGEVILLNIWATWCPPCREEMPSMQRLHEQLGPEGLQIVAVSVDAPLGRFDLGGNRGGDVEAFARELGLTFPIWLDPEGRIQRDYRTRGVPESFLINRNGTIMTKVQGETEWDSEANVASIRRLLEG